MYAEAITKLTVGGKTSRKIKINTVVIMKGSPLSPLLFNLVIDKFIDKLKKLNIGIKLGDELLCCMAFADDLVTLTEERSDKMCKPKSGSSCKDEDNESDH